MNLLELKSTIGVDDAGMITGLAWPFATPDRVGDMVQKGAFAGASMPIPMLFGHNPNEPVGAWTDAVETDEGLQVKGRLLVGQVARADEVRALVQAGALRGLSIGFSTKHATRRPGGGRTITALDLVEISLVTIPCHPGAKVTGAKSAAAAIALAEAINRAAAALRT